MPLPVEIVGLDRVEMTIVWEDGHTSVWPARELRLRCRCAHCIEEMSGANLIDEQQIPEDVKVTDIAPVGQYALAIGFSDGHQTGIFTCRDLRADCPCEPCATARGRR